MRAIKGLILFCFLGVAVSGCFDPPEFSTTPELFFKKIQFKVSESPAIVDTLVLYLDFRDGDGDLGLDQLDPNDASPPYHPWFCYIATGNGGLVEVETRPYEAFYTVNVPLGVDGKLVTNRTINEPGYGGLPPYTPPDCEPYSQFRFLVKKSDDIVDGTYNIEKDTVMEGVPYWIVDDIFMYRVNPNHYNIEIKFWIPVNGQYVEFDWEEAYCETFSGRFPTINKMGAPAEGTIRYNMQSNGWLSTFSINKLKVSATIKDRALHVSDTIITPPFSLEEIKVN